MALSVDPITYIISVPKADLTLVQASPEVRELDVNAFRLALKDWEDDPEGIVQLKTHNHNTEVTLSGLTYARIVSVLAPYTIEFEDGQYTINCIGANHNLADRKVPNQVSLIVNNAAGLITNTAIEFSSFNGGVMIDTVNGVAGTLFPIGTIQAPVNNLTDAKLIADYRGFNTYFIISDITVGTGDDIEDKTLIGVNAVQTTITIEPAALTARSTMTQCTIQGTLDGDSHITDCAVLDLDYVNGELHSCELNGTLILGGGAQASLVDCYSGVAGSALTPILDMGGSGQSLIVRDYHGGLKLINKTGPDAVSIDMSSGQLKFDNTINAGLITCRGIGLITQNDATPGTILNQMLNVETISIGVWDAVVADNQSTSSFGEALMIIGRLTGNKVTRSGDIITIYEDDESTPWRQYDLANGGRVEV